MSRYQKGKTNLDFTEARDSEWQWHQLGHMQVCTSLQTDKHSGTPPLSFLQAGCPSCHPTNSVKALKANSLDTHQNKAVIDSRLCFWCCHLGSYFKQKSFSCCYICNPLGMQASIIQCLSQARTNCEGCSRNGTQYKNGG